MTTGNSAALEFLDKLNGGPLTFAQMLNSERLCLEVSQAAFARQLGITRSFLCDIEKGRKLPNVALAYRWGEELGYSGASYVRYVLQDTLRKAGMEAAVDLRGQSAASKSAAIEFLDKLNGGPLTFAQMLNSERLCLEVSQAAFARRLGITRSYLCDIEKGRKLPSVTLAYRWGEELGYSGNDFVHYVLQDMLRDAGLEGVLAVNIQSVVRSPLIPP